MVGAGFRDAVRQRARRWTAFVVSGGCRPPPSRAWAGDLRAVGQAARRAAAAASRLRPTRARSTAKQERAALPDQACALADAIAAGRVDSQRRRSAGGQRTGLRSFRLITWIRLPARSTNQELGSEAPSASEVEERAGWTGRAGVEHALSTASGRPVGRTVEQEACSCDLTGANWLVLRQVRRAADVSPDDLPHPRLLLGRERGGDGGVKLAAALVDGGRHARAPAGKRRDRADAATGASSEKPSASTAEVANPPIVTRPTMANSAAIDVLRYASRSSGATLKAAEATASYLVARHLRRPARIAGSSSRGLQSRTPDSREKMAKLSPNGDAVRGAIQAP